jgi:chromate transporter
MVPGSHHRGEAEVTPNTHVTSQTPTEVPLSEVARLFLKLGTIAFGGPAAHIALLEDEVVRRRKWLSREQFLDLLGASNLIPGPNSTELAIHVGHHVAGWRGLLVAGACFILPAMLIVGVLGWGYVTYGALPQVDWLLYGVKPVVIAVVLQALWGLSRTAIKSRSLAGLALATLLLMLLGVNELLLLFTAGFLWGVKRWLSRPRSDGTTPMPAFTGLPVLGLVPGMVAASGTPFGLWPLFWFFLKVGSVLYGSGYVLLAFLDAGLVERMGWITRMQLLDAVAVGQITPGPVFTTATFIGYLVGGPVAALVATLGIFLPAFFFVAVSGPLIPRIRKSPIAGSVLDGVNVASLGLMAAVTIQLAQAAVTDGLTLALAVLSAALLMRFRLNSAWLVLGGALAGLLAWQLR